ncbi:MAG TPA: maleylpyruvate isomerase N-terminal domain-containing protein [Acidimicrobiia bacterium]
MRLTPTYGGGAPISFDGPSDDQAEPVARQRRRFRSMLAALDDTQWHAPTRCDGWAVCDVVAHLVTVDGFWDASVRAGLAGSPTEVLANFDPAAHPPLLIAPLQELSRADLFDRYTSACNGFLEALASVRADQWDTLGESPATCRCAWWPSTRSGTAGCTNAMWRYRSTSSHRSSPTR